MATVGDVKKEKDGRFVGRLKTLTIDVPIEITPVAEKRVENGPDYMIYSKGTECGAGWIRKGQRSGKDYVSLSFSAPEFGKGLYANLGQKAGSKDPNEFVMIWNAPTE